jgi:dTMP kinase
MWHRGGIRGHARYISTDFGTRLSFGVQKGMGDCGCVDRIMNERPAVTTPCYNQVGYWAIGKGRAMFITLEGLDGSGKTTQAAQMVHHLRVYGREVLLTREPGGTQIGDRVRTVLLDKAEAQMHPATELLLFCASRAQLVAQVIRPHLAGGGVVICDRYTDSTLAYQGYGHGLDLAMLRTILDFATDGLRPDLTLFFDVSPEEAMRRRQQASLFGEEFNRLDAMQLAFRERVYHGYQQVIQSDAARFALIDATQSMTAVAAQVLAVLNARVLMGSGTQEL